jgi:hypothetical protein
MTTDDQKIPKIRIMFSWLLYNEASKVLHQRYAKKGEKLMSYEACEDWAEKYRQEWTKYNDTILADMCQPLDLKFRQSDIEVTLAPWFKPISQPLIIGYNYGADEFVDILTHELIHVLLTDNNKYSFWGKTFDDVLVTKWKKLFGEDHDSNTLLHIPVHAVHKYIYLDVLHEESRLERDQKWYENDSSSPYFQSWRYVDGHDYKEIISQLKEQYSELK